MVEVSYSGFPEELKPGLRYGISLLFTNNSNKFIIIENEFISPEGLNLVFPEKKVSIEGNSSQWIHGFFLSSKTQISGNINIELKSQVLTSGEIITTKIPLNIAEISDLSISVSNNSVTIASGDIIEENFVLKNNGNLTLNLSLKSNAEILSDKEISLAPGEIHYSQVKFVTSAKQEKQITEQLFLEITNLQSGETFLRSIYAKIIPSTNTKIDPYLRYNLEASTYFNYYQNQVSSVNSKFAEIIGNGFLDLKKEKFLSLTVRAPSSSNLTRFGINDQYSLTYINKDKTTISLGDHTFNINRLGFNGRYGFGAKIDQIYKDWVFTSFISYPRLFQQTNKPVLGVKALYNLSDHVQLGVSVSASKGIFQYYNSQNFRPENEAGQIIVLESSFDYPKTKITNELALSLSKLDTDFATDLNIYQSFGPFSYNGNVTIAGQNFFGIINNSQRYGNNLSWGSKKLTISINQSYSKISNQLDSLNFRNLPFFQNYGLNFRYRLNKKHLTSTVLFYRQNEDLSDRKSFNYEERGLDFGYQYTGDQLSLSFNGRVGETNNALFEQNNRRSTLGVLTSGDYRISQKFSLRAQVSYDYTNRYSVGNSLINYFIYGGGMNLKINRSVRFSGTYNSGFQPENYFNKRDLINFSTYINVGRKHAIEARLNYFLRPESQFEKELFGYFKYTFRFGAPIKRILKLGSVAGNISTDDPNINIKGVEFFSAGYAVKSNSKGEFKINNIPEGQNLLLLKKSSLASDIGASITNPLEYVSKNKATTQIDIELFRFQSVSGKIILSEAAVSENLSGKINLKSEFHNYVVNINEDGSFNFDRVRPGVYILKVLEFENEKIVKSNGGNITVYDFPLEDIRIEATLKQVKLIFKQFNSVKLNL